MNEVNTIFKMVIAIGIAYAIYEFANSYDIVIKKKQTPTPPSPTNTIDKRVRFRDMVDADTLGSLL